MDEAISDMADLTEERVRQVLVGTGYRWTDQGVEVVMRLKDWSGQPGFTWEDYFRRAEANWETGFAEDELLGWRFVKEKVRDFALLEFSRFFCAIDSRIINVITRTGLQCQGFGDPEIAGGPSYDFCRRLIQQASRSFGWPGDVNAMAPGDIDQAFWFFAQDRCGARPRCEGCLARELCCTGRLNQHT